MTNSYQIRLCIKSFSNLRNSYLFDDCNGIMTGSREKFKIFKQDHFPNACFTIYNYRLFHAD